jgi:peptidoglycan/LPS O-acetylase OafA/YrhL
MLGYLPKLDGLRAVAVGLVVLHHLGNPIFANLGAGFFGVRLFFVISGYLITSILIKARSSSAPVGAEAEKFYWKRFLRLAPALLLAVGLSAWLNIANMRQDWWIHILYLTNFKVAIGQHWGDAGHFWSLAVEEQFYLFWFVAVVVLPRRWLLPMMIAGLIVSTASRSIAALAGVSQIVPAVLIVGSTECLCLGALLAYGQIVRPELDVIRRVLINPIVMLASCAVFLIAEILIADQLGLAKVTITGSASAVLAASLVSIGISDRKGILFDWLEWKPVRHIGKISYGIYVYHQFLPLVMLRFGLDPKFGAPTNSRFGAAVACLIFAGASTALAQISWSLVEKPLSSFKDYVPSSWFPERSRAKFIEDET